ncbi:MAG: hypothetical protein GQ582_04420 [Methyloprofundus sp.]|nr:hypothetical protein [Methyloprofundus sp.]
MKKIMFSLAYLFASSASAIVQGPVTLTFDDIRDVGDTTDNALMPAEYQEYAFSTPLSWVESSAFGYGAVSGTFGMFNNGNADYDSITRVDGGKFRFLGVFAKNWGSLPTDPENDPNFLFGTISGYFDGLEVWSIDTALSKGFQEIDFYGAAIHELRFDMADSSNGSYLVDNLTLQVPTPTAAWMLGAGLIGLLGGRKRKELL